MARLKFYYPIEELHGKIKGKFGAAQRQAKNNEGERRPYSVNYGTRTTPPSADELAARARFAAVSALVKTEKANSTNRATNQAAANAAGMTLLAYLWQKCGATYDASLED